jgi:hypothetical protein
MMPPAEFPHVTIPNAIPLFLAKYVEQSPMIGTKKIPPPIPVHRPCVRRNCQYVFDTLRQNTPMICIAIPNATVGRNHPRSRALPLNIPIANMRQACTDPIQLMVDAGSGSIDS